MYSNVILGERLNHLMVGGPVGVVVFGEGFAIQLDNAHSVGRVDQKVEELISARRVDDGIASSLVLVVPPVLNHKFFIGEFEINYFFLRIHRKLIPKFLNQKQILKT